MTRDLSVCAVVMLTTGLMIAPQGLAPVVSPVAVPQPAAIAPRSLIPDADPVRSCESLQLVTLPNTTVNSATIDRGDDAVPASCRITATITHPPVGDQIKVFIALPLKDWNGRFQGTGGEGFSGGDANNVRQPLTLRYAAGATDTGHESRGASFALDAGGRLNWHSIRDNAQLGIHEMTTTGKSLTEAFYGKAPARSYFSGCSAGGRQGLMEAQRFASDYDGILAGAPGIHLPKVSVTQLWGAVLMQETGNVIPGCKFDAATAAAVAACDTIDGVRDSIIEDPRLCRFDPRILIGTSAGDCGTFTSADGDIIGRIWEGPRRRDGSFMWYGLERGGDFGGFARTAGTPLVPRPNGLALEWFRYFLNQDPQWEFSGLTRASFEQYWDQSVEEFSAVFAADNPNLSAFRDRGGKIIMWHGWADASSPPQGTIDYYERVQKQMGGVEKTSTFARLFLAPGVGHCGGGVGRVPEHRIGAVVKWVEEGIARRRSTLFDGSSRPTSSSECGPSADTRWLRGTRAEEARTMLPISNVEPGSEKIGVTCSQQKSAQL